MVRPPPTSHRFVDGYLLYLLAAASEAVSAQFHAELRGHGLSVAEWRVLACLSDADGLMVTELAMLALTEQSRMTRIIDRMDERGLVRRRADSDDRRRVWVGLTAEGLALAVRLVADAKKHEQAVLAAMEPADAGRIKAILQTLLRHLGQTAGAGK